MKTGRKHKGTQLTENQVKAVGPVAAQGKGREGPTGRPRVWRQ